MSIERKLTAVVVDDDFMIARVHAKFIDGQFAYRVVGTAYTGEQAFDIVTQTCPDLLILDIYLPDQSGLDVLGKIRAKKIPCDVILITAANELHVVEEGFRLGIFDYLMKPFNLTRLGESLQKYAHFKKHLTSSSRINQDTVDHLRQIRATGAIYRNTTESGIDQRTLERVKLAIDKAGHACTAEDVAKIAGVSRSTARTYLDYLVESHAVMEELSYGAVGRPRRLFYPRK